MKILGLLENAGLEQLTSNPTPAYPGRMYIDITTPSASIPKMYDGTTWQKMLISYQQGSNDILNLGLAVSVASSAMTISLKQADGATDPTALAPVYCSFRSSTVASGSFTQRSATAAASLVVPASATLGTVSAVAKFLWVYLIDNAGTMELAVSSLKFDEGSVQSSTAISAAATSASVLYSTTSRSSKAIRCIGRLLVNEATAGTWASLPTEIAINPKQPPALCLAAYYGTNTTYADGDIVQFNTKIHDNYNAVVTGASWLFTVPTGCGGLYRVNFSSDIISSATTGIRFIKTGTGVGQYFNPVAGKTLTAGNTYLLAAGDTIRFNAIAALQMDITDVGGPNILIQQLTWI